MSDGTPTPSISVVIPTYERADDVANLLHSLDLDRQGVEAIVVDDRSPDPSVFDSVKGRFPGVRFIHMEENQGPGATRNRGAREASGEVLLFLDSDTELVPGSIEAVRHFFSSNPQAQVCSGGISTEPINAGFFPKYKALLEASWVPSYDCDITFVAGRCFAIRRAAMLSVGGFSRSYKGADVEDYEFGYRVRQRFGSIRFLPNLLVRHRYPTPRQQAKLYHKRVKLWMDLRPEGRMFDDVGTSRKEALVSVLSALLPFVLVGSFLANVPLWGLVFLLITVAANADFLASCLRKHGLGFTLLAQACHCYLAVHICVGATEALLKRICEARAARRRAPEM